MPEKTSPIVKTATESDEARLIDVLVLAFSTDPAARWTWRNPHDYLLNFPRLVSALADKAFANKTAYFVDGYGGASLWLPPDVRPEEDALTELLLSTTSERIRDDLPKLFEKMGSYHPAESHWYLPFIGVDPFLQGHGFGSALLKHVLLQCDRDQKFAYLDSSSPRNIPLYERHGFELMGKIQVGTSPTIFPMLRKPHE